MKIPAKTAFAFLLASGFVAPLLADVMPPICLKSEVDPTVMKCTIFITGEIKRADVSAFDDAVRRVKKIEAENARGKTLTDFRLDSQGGDISAAIDIGRRLRMNNALVAVAEQDVCASACVLLLAGGTLRMIWGPVIVHRPYSTFVGDKPTGAIRIERDQLRASIRQYLDDVDVSQNLLEIMEGVPADKGKQLSEEELELLRLSGFDPITAEQMDAREAERLGLTRQELLQRRIECRASAEGRELQAIADAYFHCLREKDR